MHSKHFCQVSCCKLSPLVKDVQHQHCREKGAHKKVKVDGTTSTVCVYPNDKCQVRTNITFPQNFTKLHKQFVKPAHTGIFITYIYAKQTHARAFQLMTDSKIYAAFAEKHPELKGIVSKTFVQEAKALVHSQKHPRVSDLFTPRCGGVLL